MKAARDERVRPATLREEQKLFTKRLFVETAKRVFAERGYGAATVEDIVKAARASRATFYAHFTSKAEVMAEIYESLMPATAEYWRRLDRSLGSRHDLKSWLEEAIDWWEKHRDILPALHEAAVVDQEIATKQYTNLHRLSDELTGYFAAARGPKKRAEARLRIMSTRNIGVNLHTLPVVTVGIGFGIDYGLYIVSRIIEEIRVCGDLYESVKTALCTTGKGVTFTAVTMVMSTMFWTTSNIRFDAEMGGLLAIWMAISFVASQTLMPVLILIFKPRFITREIRQEAVRADTATA